jgi:hypothetical protein
VKLTIGVCALKKPAPWPMNSKVGKPKAIMLRIAADYDKLVEWAEQNSTPWWDKKRGESK